jgi:hypothetical protein
VHSGGVVRPAPNTENAALTGESAQRNRDERRTAAIPTFHHPRARLPRIKRRYGLDEHCVILYSMRITQEIRPWLSLASVRLTLPWLAGITA